jgi:hypothetical protein
VLITMLLVGCIASVVVAPLFILRSPLGTVVVEHQDAHLPRPRRGAEITWAIVPAIALMPVLWATWRESRAAIEPLPAMPGYTGHGAPAS